MHPVVKQLLALQKVDARVAGVRGKLEAVPRETARRRKRLDDLTRERNTLAKALEDAETGLDDLESKVRALDAAIKRQETHRDQASNASSFTAAQHQIEYLIQDRDSVQASQLELMEAIERQTPLVADLDGKLAAAQAEFDAYAVEADKLTAELKAKYDAVAAERAQYLAEVPRPSLAMYDDLFRRTGGTAVVPTEGDHCSGCYTRLTPNDQALLRTGTTLVLCKSCGRILYQD